MPLFRRFGRPGLLDSVARTAVVAGTTAMTARAVGRGTDRSAPAPPAESGAQASPAESITAQLATLSSLRETGAISDDEFARAKNRVLA